MIVQNRGRTISLSPSSDEWVILIVIEIVAQSIYAREEVQDIQSLLVQNRLLTEEVKRRIDQLAAINTVAATVSQSLDLNRTLKNRSPGSIRCCGRRSGWNQPD